MPNITSVGHPERLGFPEANEMSFGGSQCSEVLGAKQSEATKTCACAGIYEQICTSFLNIKLLLSRGLSKLLYRFLRRYAPRFCIGSLALPQQNFVPLRMTS